MSSELYACTGCGTVNVTEHDECPSCGNDEYEPVELSSPSTSTVSTRTSIEPEEPAEPEEPESEGESGGEE